MLPLTFDQSICPKILCVVCTCPAEWTMVKSPFVPGDRSVPRPRTTRLVFRVASNELLQTAEQLALRNHKVMKDKQKYIRLERTKKKQMYTNELGRRSNCSIMSLSLPEQEMPDKASTYRDQCSNPANATGSSIINLQLRIKPPRNHGLRTW